MIKKIVTIFKDEKNILITKIVLSSFIFGFFTALLLIQMGVPLL